MTQDQYGQARGAGYGAGGDVVDTGDDPSDQDRPMTRFQKVASALRGDKPDRDEEGQADPAEGTDMTADTGTTESTAADPATGLAGQGQSAGAPWGARPDEAGAQREDYWEVPDPRADQAAAATSPDAPATEMTGQDETRPDIPGAQDPASTQPDLYEPDRGAGDTVAGDPVAEDRVPGDVAGDPVAEDRVPADVAGDQVGATTISDVPVTSQEDVPDGTGRHAAAGPSGELRPGEGEGEGTLEDFSDLAYGNLLPDATVFTEQWQQIQFRFVDDPQASVTEAAEVVAQVTAKLEAAIQERQRAIEARQQAIQERQRSLRGRWGEGTQADTETLRETLRMYRAFLDQLIGPKA
jgi:hypothetical protein